MAGEGVVFGLHGPHFSLWGVRLQAYQNYIRGGQQDGWGRGIYDEAGPPLWPRHEGLSRDVVDVRSRNGPVVPDEDFTYEELLQEGLRQYGFVSACRARDDCRSHCARFIERRELCTQSARLLPRVQITVGNTFGTRRGSAGDAHRVSLSRRLEHMSQRWHRRV